MKWEKKPLGEFCRLVNGKAFKAEDWSESGLPIVRIQNLNDSTKPFNYWDGGIDRQVHIHKGDLLIAWSGTPGTSFGAHIWKGPEGVLNQHIFRVDLQNAMITNDWLRFCVNFKLLSLIDQAHGGVGLKHVTKGAIESLSIPLPPLSEQKRIAGILDAADALRAKRREALAQLDTLLQSTFLDMFGDPVTNPMGWEISTIGSYVKIMAGFAFKSTDFANIGCPIIRISNLERDTINLKDCARIPPASLGKGKRFRIQPGDTLIAMSGATTGKLGFVPDDLDEEWYLNQRVGAFRIPDCTSVKKQYLRAILKSSFYQNIVWNLAGGAAQPNISSKQLESAEIPLPPIYLQDKFSSIVESVERQKAAMRAHLAELDTLFASLQSRAFNGEL
ncbi:MAG TPA: hypothetical protein DEW46_14415 [Verrucomicrobia bacterium]|jgi:type I restriction enzyme S subunit|nr:hypothetical protein [Verrucomicrobiota bacterium]